MLYNQTNKLDLKRANRNRIYQLVYSSKKISKPDIALQLEISLPTVLQNIKSLIAEGLLEEGEALESTGGRKAISVICCPQARYAVGIDITKNHISVLLINILGEIIDSTQDSMSFANDEGYYKDIGQRVEKLIMKHSIPLEKILGVGISVPGILSEDLKMLMYSHVLQVNNLSVMHFSRYIPYPCLLYNDANAAGFAEMWHSRDVKNAVYLSLSNSVGGAIILDNQVYAGQNQRGGEFGHMTIVKDGHQCYCGKDGCMDAYCSALVLSRHTDNNLSLFFRKLEKQDKEITQIWDEYLSYLAMSVNNLRIIFDCPVILGGYVGAYLDDYTDDLRQRVSKRNTFLDLDNYLQVCRYKRESAAVGAALLHIEPFINNI